ncbi:TPA: autotransporter outer membrane beta-barrel domain-containing protein [Yersinia enterocolitica]|nr:autotransporter outer membrane beta-barrel domain-containing protein [Yersinia enterocolitica]HDL7830240.1 autotransporter outer membrane beta-barrel domain-containing protein [Yersinia enterocolitica]HDL7871096.1 autotransporter outer membrane beta-barrel domain-containing protein [Yersinia enterocolitica]HDL7884780.1 autotransporter outer membrane beta-barrel domain-containing protein [Yersinia enterocolitica]HDL7892272.1 autotransporter outer membrane beta-barrel domain-containing protein
MNRIYSLKFCYLTQGLIAVSELSRKTVKRTGRKLLRISLISTAIASIAYPTISQAGIVRADIAYQIYRDFAENKGIFVPGTTNIPVYDKDGKLVGRLDKAPMADFSSVSTNGVATLVSPQYVVSVKHNGGYQSVGFGNGKNTYSLVDRNNHPSVDFHAPRLNKLVTEVIPSAVTAEGTKLNAYKNTERYTAFYRVGSGSQYIQTPEGKRESLSGAYSYLTGGTIGPLSSSGNGGRVTASSGKIFDSSQGPLGNHGRPGDSGSPLFAYDALQKNWVLIGVLTGGNDTIANWNVIPIDYLNQVMQDDFDAPVNQTSGQGPLNWTYDKTSGTGTLSQGSKNWAMHGQKGNDLNTGKNLVFSGQNGAIILKDSVSQGAGYLEFKDSYTVSAESGKTWTGAGIITDKGADVTWKVNGVAGDNLHKLGEGTLTINGTGVNPGGLKTGDGTVVLNQQADEAGNVQAFSSVNLASGRPTVVLADARQVNPDNISWGYRGGKLDLNGNAVTFTRLQAADYGAVITNNAQQKSQLLLNMSVSQNSDVSVPIGNISPFGGTGTPGNLYSMTLNNQTHFYILKSATYGNTLWGNSLNDPKQWEYVGMDKNKAIQTVKDRVLVERAKQPVIYHGQLTGNMDVTIPQLPGDRSVVLDGSVNLPRGSLSKEGGTLIFQGHPVIHASVKGSNPVSLTQKDWDTRLFTLQTLSLKDTDFHISRNAALKGDIQSDNSHITLGSGRVFVDKNDGTGNYVNPEEGTSTPDTVNDRSQYEGSVTLNNNSTLDIGSRFSGGIEAYDSSINVTSSDALLTKAVMFANSSLNIQDGGHLTAQKGIYSDARIQVGKGSTLSLSGTPVDSTGAQYSPVLYLTEGYDLKGENASLNITQGAHVSGDIFTSAPAHINIGSGKPAELPSLSASSTLASSLLNGYNAAFNGAITGGQGDVSMQNALWELNGDSTIRTLTARNSRVNSGSDRAFRTLTMENLDATGSDFVLRTDLKNADKIHVTEKATGSDNSLNVSFMKNPAQGQALNIPLVTAPAGTSVEVFKAGTRVTGFSRVTATLHVDTGGDSTKWILDGFRTEADKAAAAKAESFMNAGYKNFMTEVNNLNKRMGELRDTNGDAGAWARIMNGAGSAEGGYSDNYTHVQVGVDKKHELDGLDLFTGITMTYTDSSADSNAFSGKTKSVGGGLYASALFNSGAYIDLIGKYIHHDNDYTGNFAGLGTKQYGTHSWYAGAETGYRYHMTEDTFIEPQAELVYGAVSGKTFRWKDGDMDLSMKNKDFSLLIGRTGIELGKTFSGQDWSVTARAGTNWQFDLLNNSATVLRDAYGEKRIKGEKDSRMLFNVGMNVQIKDNMRFGLEFEKSAFGQYNVDNAINANFRYTF